MEGNLLDWCGGTVRTPVFGLVRVECWFVIDGACRGSLLDSGIVFASNPVGALRSLSRSLGKVMAWYAPCWVLSTLRIPALEPGWMNDASGLRLEVL